MPVALSHSTEMVQELQRGIKDRSCRKLGQWMVKVWRKDVAGTETLKMRGWEDQKAGAEFVRNSNPSGRVRESCKGLILQGSHHLKLRGPLQPVSVRTLGS